MHHTQYRTADKVYERRDDRNYRIALYKLRSTVHCAEEVAFTLYFRTAYLCLFIGYCACVQVSINSHLLTGHSVKGKSCGNFGYTLRTFGDNKEVYYYYDYEYDKSDNSVTAHYEFAERLYDLAGIAV